MAGLSGSCLPVTIAGVCHQLFQINRQPRGRRLRGALLAGLLVASALPAATAGAADLTESFDSWPPSNWTIQNNSVPVGSLSWFHGTATTATPTPGPFNSYNGA